jgi:stage II sporulation protein M
MSGIVTAGLTTAGTLAIVSLSTTESLSDARRLGLRPRAMLALLLPHGLLEIAAFIMAGAAGFGGVPIVIAAAEGNTALTREYVRGSLRLGLASAGVLVVAALLETFVTPVIAGWFI